MCSFAFFASFLMVSLFSYVKPLQAERFKSVEIRVIRPKYFSKRKRFELGTELTTVMNETFIYTFIPTGLATFHLSESWALEGGAGYGLSIDREDKKTLLDDFDIKTKIFRTNYLFWGSLSYTPIYGKWQLPGGSLIYFDTFLNAGAGLTGLGWRYSEFCEKPSPEDQNYEPLPGDRVVSYPTILGGVGQRYFIDKRSAVRVDIRGHSVIYNTADSGCRSGAEGGSDSQEQITLSIGMSRFF